MGWNSGWEEGAAKVSKCKWIVLSDIMELLIYTERIFDNLNNSLKCIIMKKKNLLGNSILFPLWNLSLLKHKFVWKENLLINRLPLICVRISIYNKNYNSNSMFENIP